MLGQVKTRLAADIGDIAARRIYRDLTQRVLRQVAAHGPWCTRLAVTPDCYAARGRFWPNHLPRLAQGTGDLGARLARATSAVIDAGPTIIIGTDIPGIAHQHIADAFRLLRTHDAVFGPAEDGGYWLVGMKSPTLCRKLFRGIRWSSADTLSDTLARLSAHDRVALLPTLFDIDTLTDLRRWRMSG